MPIMSLRQYARHRGVGLSAVQKAISSKRVSTLKDGRVDSETADAEWKRNTRAPPPLGNEEDPRGASLRGLRVVVREKAFQLRARVLVHDGLRDDLREGGVRGEERGGGNSERLKRFHTEHASNPGIVTQRWPA